MIELNIQAITIPGFFLFFVAPLKLKPPFAGFFFIPGGEPLPVWGINCLLERWRNGFFGSCLLSVDNDKRENLQIYSFKGYYSTRHFVVCMSPSPFIY